MRSRERREAWEGKTQSFPEGENGLDFCPQRGCPSYPKPDPWEEMYSLSEVPWVDCKIPLPETHPPIYTYLRERRLWKLSTIIFHQKKLRLNKFPQFLSFCCHDTWNPVCSLMHAQLSQSCPTLCSPWTAAHQAPMSMEFSKQEYGSGLPFPTTGDLPDPGIEPASHVSCIARWILYH